MCDDGDDRMWSIYVWLWGGGAGAPRAAMRGKGVVIVLLTKTGPRCISFRCKITVSLAQGAVHDAEADVADPVFVRSTIDQDEKSPGPKRFLNQEAGRKGGLGAGGLSTTAGKDVGGA